jgi:hypothetical protein
MKLCWFTPDTASSVAIGGDAEDVSSHLNLAAADREVEDSLQFSSPG